MRVEAVTTASRRGVRLRLITLKAAHHDAVKPLTGVNVRQPRQRPRPGPGRGAGRRATADRRHRRVGRHQPRPRPPRADHPRPVRGRRARRPPRAHAAARGGAAPAADVRAHRRHPLRDLGEAARQQRVQRPRRGRGADVRRRGRNPTGAAVALRMWREGYDVGLAQGLHPGHGARRRGVSARRRQPTRRSPPRWRATARPTPRCSRTSSAAPSPRST